MAFIIKRNHEFFIFPREDHHIKMPDSHKLRRRHFFISRPFCVLPILCTFLTIAVARHTMIGIAPGSTAGRSVPEQNRAQNVALKDLSRASPPSVPMGEEESHPPPPQLRCRRLNPNDVAGNLTLFR